MARGETCLGCRFWAADPDTRARWANKLDATTAMMRIRKDETYFIPCHRYPPMPDPRRALIPPGATPANWPLTAATDWCGEFLPALAAEEPEPAPRYPAFSSAAAAGAK